MPSVLVVEDDFSSRQFIQFMLKKLDYDMLVAESGEQALELMQDKTVDVMLLDIALGDGISGLDLMQEFRRQGRFNGLPMIAVTAFRDMKDELLQKGFTDFLGKPYTFENLKEMLLKYQPVLT